LSQAAAEREVCFDP